MSEPEEPSLSSSESASLERGYRRLLAVDLLKGAARMRLRPCPGQPRTVSAAVRLLRLGAVAELGALLTILATTATVRAAVAAFFGLTTMSLLLALSVGSPVYATADFAAGMVVWFISLVSMVLVFTPASNRYFRTEPTALASPAG